MFEKVNPYHPDKVADRIAGALVDIAYQRQQNPRIAVEVLLGHGQCNIIAETSADITADDCHRVVTRIAGYMPVYSKIVQQDAHLAENQQDGIRCGDNGIFRGMPVTVEQELLTLVARRITEHHSYDGKYIISGKECTICQSHMTGKEAADVKRDLMERYGIMALVNPLGEWTGGLDVDSGATNRKLGSDMGDAVTGGGLHGKDLSKADVTLNIYCHLKAQQTGKPFALCCSIGDSYVDGKPYEDIVETARKYVSDLGGFEKFAEWGLIR